MSSELLPINHSKSLFSEGGFDLFFFLIIEQVIIRCLLSGRQYTRYKEQTGMDSAFRDIYDQI